MLLVLAGCSTEKDSLPPELYQRWVTTNRRYVGRYFEVVPGPAAVGVFGQGDGASHSGTVMSVVRSPVEATGERCEIDCLDPEGLEFNLVLELSPGCESFVFENSPKVLWQPREGLP